MKNTFLHASSPSAAVETFETTRLPVDRRSFVKLAAAGLGVLAGTSSAQAIFPGIFQRRSFLPQGPVTPLPPAPPGVPLTFEVGSGVVPPMMLRMVQDYIAVTLSPDWAGLLVEARVTPRVPVSFHDRFWSDYSFYPPIAPMRNRYGFYVSVDNFVRGDFNLSILGHKDMNYYEIRRLIDPSEVTQFGTVLHPCSHRRPPTPFDFEQFVRVSQLSYSIVDPERMTLLYTRLFSNGRYSFVGYCCARGPEPMRSPLKDVFLGTVPV